MADDWKAGDLAVCVQDNWLRGGFIPMIVAPRKEQVLRVAGVKRDRGACSCGECDTAGLYLAFDEFGNDWFVAGGFRKVRPDGTEEKVDRQEGISWFKRLLKDHKAKEPEVV